MAFLSVVIPLYNKQDSIANTLESVREQSFMDFEIIIVNDGSTDKSATVVSTIKDDRISLYTTLNQGVSAARNFGVEKANSPFIAFIDADDYWYPNHLEQLVKLYKTFPNCGLYATNYENYYSKNKVVPSHFEAYSQPNWQGIVTDFFESSKVYRMALTSAVAIEKTVLLNNKGFDPELNYGEDLDLWIRIASTQNVAFCNTVSVRYFFEGPNRISDSPTLKRKFPKLNQYKTEESNNPSMKCFLDLYRAEFAIKFKLANDFPTFQFYKNQIDLNNLSLKTKVILKLPTLILKVLYAFKKYLERKNILISIYH